MPMAERSRVRGKSFWCPTFDGWGEGRALVRGDMRDGLRRAGIADGRRFVTAPDI